MGCWTPLGRYGCNPKFRADPEDPHDVKYPYVGQLPGLGVLARMAPWHARAVDAVCLLLRLERRRRLERGNTTICFVYRKWRRGLGQAGDLVSTQPCDAAPPPPQPLFPQVLQAIVRRGADVVLTWC